MKCEKCGHEQKDMGRAKGGKSRWSKLTKEQRSEAMRKIRNAAKDAKRKRR